jgi:organic radical activating enzyme
MKNLSIITDFGCPFSCSFCVTHSQKTKKSFVFDSNAFNILREAVNQNQYRRISVSGGGEPLFLHTSEIENFYAALFEFGKEMNIPIHVHTNLDKPNETAFLFDKVAISINPLNYSKKFNNWGSIQEKRFVHVSDGTDFFIIKKMIEALPKEAQLTIKQLEELDISEFTDIIEFVKDVKNVMFLPTGDYNTYFSLNDQKMYSEFKKIQFKGV